MKVTIKSYNAVAAWKWDTSDEPHKVFKFAGASDDPYGDDDDDDDECGICRLAFESCCPDCKVPGDDCPLSEFDLSHLAMTTRARICSLRGGLMPVWGECTHIFHMHCLLKWIGTESSKGQCPLDRREWGTCLFWRRCNRADVQSRRRERPTSCLRR